MANIVQIRRGQSVPEDGTLLPYEMGYRICSAELKDIIHRNDREFYIGEQSADKKSSVSKRIDLSYFNSDVPCIIIQKDNATDYDFSALPLGTLILEY